MSRQAKLFVFVLTDEEKEQIAGARGSGGHQNFHRRLMSELEHGNRVTMDDEQLGELVRYMTQYRSGGFQSRLRKAFMRSLQEQLGFQDKLL